MNKISRDDLALANHVITQLNAYIKKNKTKIISNTDNRQTEVKSIARIIYKTLGVSDNKIDQHFANIFNNATDSTTIKLKIFYDESNSAQYDPTSWSATEYALEPANLQSFWQAIEQTASNIHTGILGKSELKNALSQTLTHHTPSIFALLYTDVMIKVFEFSLQQDLIPFRLVCTTWQQVIDRSNQLWEKFLLNESKSSTKPGAFKTFLEQPHYRLRQYICIPLSSAFAALTKTMSMEDFLTSEFYSQTITSTLHVCPTMQAAERTIDNIKSANSPDRKYAIFAVQLTPDAISYSQPQPLSLPTTGKMFFDKDGILQLDTMSKSIDYDKHIEKILWAKILPDNIMVDKVLYSKDNQSENNNTTNTSARTNCITM